MQLTLLQGGLDRKYNQTTAHNLALSYNALSDIAPPDSESSGCAGKRWTSAQRAAIDMRGRNLLVSASAGSGKTAVLIERVLSLLGEGARLNEMLIVTYTRAAASEMRQRLFDALTEAADKSDYTDHSGSIGIDRLREQVSWIETADIRTLHSFCGQLLKSSFQAADVDPMYRVLDPVQSAALRAKAMDQALIEWYDVHRASPPGEPYLANDQARALVECQSPADLATLTDKLYKFIMARPDPWDWLQRSLDGIPTTANALANSSITRSLLDEASANLTALQERARKLTDQCSQLDEWRCFVKTAQADEDSIKKARVAAKLGYDIFRDALQSHEWEKRARQPKGADPGAKDSYDAKRGLIKKEFKKAADESFLLSLASHAKDCRDMKRELEALAELTHMFDAHYTALKDEHGALDYNDLEQRSLKALADESVADSLRTRYAHIFVDEYQDSTPLQEALLQRIARGDNMFFVGDVKQSIYRFRDAEPGLFLSKYQLFEYINTSLPAQWQLIGGSKGDGARIDLDQNFRSTKAILQAVNDVFTNIQRASAFEIDYDDKAQMKPGRQTEGADAELHILVKDIDSVSESATKTDAVESDRDIDDSSVSPIGESDAIDAEEERLLKDVELEAHMAALRIQQIVDSTKVGYGDIVILMRSAARSAVGVQDVLREHGIPARTDDAQDFFDQLEVRQAIDLLLVIDNPRQDIPLIGVLRGPALGLDEAQLAHIRLADPDGKFYDALRTASEETTPLGADLRAFIDKIESAQFRARIQPIHTLLSAVLDETNLYASAGAKPNGSARQANLRQLLNRAEQYQRERGGSLHSFLSALEEQEENGGAAASDQTAPSDCVRIMTIHKSKGLQFNTVFILGLGKRFNRRDESAPLLMHSHLGLSLRVYNADQMTSRTPLASRAIRAAIKHGMMSEEMRILYVAMTRAQERLFMYGSTAWQDWMDEAGHSVPSDTELLQVSSMLEWLIRGIPRIENAQSDDIYEPNSFDPYELPARRPWRMFTHTTNIAQSAIPAKESEIHPADTVTTTPPQPLTVPTPTTPTNHNASIPDASTVSYFPRIPPMEFIPYKQTVTEQIHAAQTNELSLPERPLFIQANALPTATESGTALHSILAHTDLKAMRSEPILNVLKTTVARLLHNGILSDIQAQTVTLQPLYLFYSSDTGKRLIASDEVHREWAFNLLERNSQTIVQGVIDCAFMTENGWVLVDYKSDRTKDLDALAVHYSAQIRMYSDALTRITQIPVCERVLYMLSYNKAYSISADAALNKHEI
ncbi:ATP-dependent helicase/nuclease subunit A [Clostridia bacterium]|nr:ATP-dependent helicase/nuclease subunit A [Clostridia bacterium]